MTEPIVCTADAGVTTNPEGKAVAVPCEHPAEVVVTYAGVDRTMCPGHAHTFCRSRPDATVRPVGEAPR